jgi:hypothetical protein
MARKASLVDFNEQRKYDVVLAEKCMALNQSSLSDFKEKEVGTKS